MLLSTDTCAVLCLSVRLNVRALFHLTICVNKLKGEDKIITMVMILFSWVMHSFLGITTTGGLYMIVTPVVQCQTVSVMQSIIAV